MTEVCQEKISLKEPFSSNYFSMVFSLQLFLPNYNLHFASFENGESLGKWQGGAYGVFVWFFLV